MWTSPIHVNNDSDCKYLCGIKKLTDTARKTMWH
jgi:hypothetical protein